MKSPIILLLLTFSFAGLFAQSIDKPEVFEQNGRFGLKSSEGEILIPATYPHITEEGFNFYKLSDNNLYGLADTTGKIIIPVKYQSLRLTGGEYLIFRQNHLLGLMDLNQNVLIAPEYDEIDPWASGSAYNPVYTGIFHVVKQGVSRFLDETGKEKLPDNIQELRDDQPVVKGETADGLTYVKYCQYAKVYTDFAECYNCRSGFSDGSGKMVFALPENLIPEGNETLMFSDGLARVKDAQKQKFGFINTNGELVIPCTFDRAGPFSEGLAWAVRNIPDYFSWSDDKILENGYIGKDGKFAFQVNRMDGNKCIYWGEPFKNGTASMFLRENGMDCRGDISLEIAVDQEGKITTAEQSDQKESEEIPLELWEY